MEPRSNPVCAYLLLKLYLQDSIYRPCCLLLSTCYLYSKLHPSSTPTPSVWVCHPPPFPTCFSRFLVVHKLEFHTYHTLKQCWVLCLVYRQRIRHGHVYGLPKQVQEVVESILNVFRVIAKSFYSEHIFLCAQYIDSATGWTRYTLLVCTAYTGKYHEYTTTCWWCSLVMLTTRTLTSHDHNSVIFHDEWCTSKSSTLWRDGLDIHCCCALPIQWKFHEYITTCWWCSLVTAAVHCLSKGSIMSILQHADGAQ